MSAGASCHPQRLYPPRRARDSPLYRLVEDHHQTLEQVHDDRFAKTHGFWHRETKHTLLEFLDCGLPEHGFARLRCDQCRSELFVTFSCKTGGFCPSCQAKRATLWAEWLCEELLLPVRHHQWVFTIPKRLRLFFLYDRALLGDLARCAARSISKLYKDRAIVQGGDPEHLSPGIAVAIQTHGDYANWQPRLHALVSAGLADPRGEVTPLDLPGPKSAEADFQRRVLRMLLRRDKLSRQQVDSMLAWPHSGFSVHNAVHADPADPADHQEIQRLARYLLHPPIALERLDYRGNNSPLVYKGRRPDPISGAASRDIEPLKFLADLCMHIPPPRSHLTRLYGAYSTRHRVEQARLRQDTTATTFVVHALPGEQTPDRPEPPPSPRLRKRKADWARLLSKVFEIDPTSCPCGGTRRIIAVILDPAVVRKILDHVRKIEARAHAPPPDAR